MASLFDFLVGTSRFELLTPCVSSKCSPPELRAFVVDEDEFLYSTPSIVKQEF